MHTSSSVENALWKNIFRDVHAVIPPGLQDESISRAAFEAIFPAKAFLYILRNKLREKKYTYLQKPHQKSVNERVLIFLTRVIIYLFVFVPKF